MRNTFTLLLLLFIITGSAQSVLQKNNPADADAGYQFKTVCLPLIKDQAPLYIVDGVPVEPADLGKLDPALIDSIFILKDSHLKIFSCRNPRPVVLIITRRSNNTILIITDKDGHAPVYGATVTFISSDKRDTLMPVVDSVGKAPGIHIYPNPVQRGQLITSKLLQGYFPEGRIQVISMEGHMMLSVPVTAGKKQRLIQFPTEQRWASGIYFIQLIYANGRVGASEKVIIQ